MADDSAKTDGAELPKDILAPAEGPRENLVVTAVKFLLNPKVRQSPLSQKKAFLENKGLTSDEIQLAIQRAGVADDAPLSPSAQQSAQHPAAYANSALVPAHQLLPLPPPLSPWTKAREIATTTAIVAAVSYAVYNLFKVYISPWLLGKSETEARLERLERNIAQLHTSAAESSSQMAITLKAIQESLSVNRDKSVQGAEVSLRQESHALSEIKSEISSLKGLLLNRRQFPPPPTTSPVVPSWQMSAQPQLSPLKPEGASSPADNTTSDSTDDKILNAESSLKNEQMQPLNNGAIATNQTSASNPQTSQSEVDIPSSGSNSSTNGAFEMVKENCDSSDVAAELD